jgi:hypothetical protein
MGDVGSVGAQGSCDSDMANEEGQHQQDRCKSHRESAMVEEAARAYTGSSHRGACAGVVSVQGDGRLQARACTKRGHRYGEETLREAGNSGKWVHRCGTCITWAVGAGDMESRERKRVYVAVGSGSGGVHGQWW